jgi:hypothetical protein
MASKRRETVKTGCSRMEEYQIWNLIIYRCTNPNNSAFANYGGRGITICDAWRRDFTRFLQDVGRRPSSAHTLDRIDNDRGYMPGNVRWATKKEQNRNRRSNTHISAFGKTMTLIEWSELYKVASGTILNRLKLGWPMELALATPVKRSQRYLFAPADSPRTRPAPMGRVA